MNIRGTLIYLTYFLQLNKYYCFFSFKEKGVQEGKQLSEEALQRAEERRVKGEGEKERYTQLNIEFQRVKEEMRSPS